MHSVLSEFLFSLVATLVIAKLPPSVPLLLSVLVTSPFIPSGNTSLCQVTRGHFFYSQSMTSVPSCLLSPHSSEMAFLLFAFSLECFQSSVCPPSRGVDMPSVCTHKSFSVVATSVSFSTTGAACTFLLLCLQV